MILPICKDGDPVLREKTVEISPDYPDIEDLILNMYETMCSAGGIGIAAPQIGLPIRLFVIKAYSFKIIMINPEILEVSEELVSFDEGCLSVPNIRQKVFRPLRIKIKYQDMNFIEHTENFTGFNARVIQHEYDHLEGKLFTDYKKNT